MGGTVDGMLATRRAGGFSIGGTTGAFTSSRIPWARRKAGELNKLSFISQNHIPGLR